MGLDVTAYKKITILPGVVVGDDGEFHNSSEEEHDFLSESNFFSVWVNPDFPEQAKGLVDGAVYSYTDADSIHSGYGSHYYFRDELARLAGYPTARNHYGQMNHFAGACLAQSGFFHELINFSDCDGCIGTEVSKKLLSDFMEKEEEAKAIGGGFYERYQEWVNIFTVASDDGCVVFH